MWWLDSTKKSQSSGESIAAESVAPFRRGRNYRTEAVERTEMPVRQPIAGPIDAPNKRAKLVDILTSDQHRANGLLLEAASDVHDSEIKKLDSDLARLEESVLEKTTQIERLVAQLARVSGEREHAVSQVFDQIELRAADNQRLGHYVVGYEKQLAACTNDQEKLEAQLERLREDYEQKVADAESKLACELKRNRANTEAAEMAAASWADKMRRMQQEQTLQKAQSTAQTAKLAAEIESLRAQAASDKKEWAVQQQKWMRHQLAWTASQQHWSQQLDRWDQREQYWADCARDWDEREFELHEQAEIARQRSDELAEELRLAQRELANAIDVLATSDRNHRADLSHLKIATDSLHAQLDIAKSKCGDLTARLAESVAERVRIESQIEQSKLKNERENRQLKNELGQTQNLLDRFEAEAYRHRWAMQQTQYELSSRDVSLSISQSALAASHSARCESQSALAVSQTECAEARSALAASRAACSKSQLALAASKEAQAKTEASVSESILAHQETKEKLQTLTTKWMLAEYQSQSWETEAYRLNSIRHFSSQEIDRLTIDIASLDEIASRECEASQFEIRGLQEILAESDTKLQASRNEFETILESTRETASDGLREAADQVRRLEVSLHQCRQELAQVCRDHQTTINQRDAKSTELEQLKANLHAIRGAAGASQTDLAATANALATCRMELSAKEGQLSITRAELEAKHAECVKLLNEASATNSELTQTQDELAQAWKLSQSATDQLQRQESTLAKMQDQERRLIEIQNSEFASFQTRIDELQVAAEELTMTLEDEREHRVKAEQEAQRLQQEQDHRAAFLHEQRDDLIEQIRLLREHSDIQQADLEQLRVAAADADASRSETARLRARLSAGTARGKLLIEHYRRRLKAAGEQLDRCQREIEELRSSQSRRAA
ncbi:coiled-coil domain-containing protein [Rubripirellula reticaptiva]|uniref:Chromosome partition protein Smc n=1 Tax=Rubripirellula reticaptiva TaxID=2528013 RepID=A0A5C6EU55_9BACT|nr:hypothetical protein [Rubripirellula reticaptiva]TWU51136.1 Chromosome partition protein Smc [Rubripirellula reticaptiva]